MTLSPGARLGPYEILALVGAGGMGEVYRARDSRLGRTVAIKILPQHVLDSPARRQRFEREARTASRLSHPHICALYDIGEHDRIHFIVMEYLEGQTLAERLRRGPLPVNQVLRCAIEIADALHHAHRAGIVHRDLKPANVMLTPSGAKLLDFGVARLAESGDSEDAQTLRTAETEPITEAGTILGTLHYMAPEQLEGKEADPRTDIFALGTVVYEMATARRAFDGATKASLIAAILEHDPPPLSSVGHTGSGPGSERLVTPALDHVVARCLAKDPDERWQTAADLRQELKWIADDGAQAASRRPGMRARLRRSLAWAAGGLAVAAAVGYFVARSGWMEVPPAETTFTQLTFRRGLVSEARFGPDDQTIFYAAAWDGGPMRLYQTRSRAPESGTFGPPSAGLAAVSSANEFALLLDCTLEYGFCVGTLARMFLGGAPRPLLEKVVSADWDPDGLQLAAVQQMDGEYRVVLAIGNRILHKSTGRVSWLRFSPDGGRLAFMEFPVIDEETGTLNVIDLNGRVSTLVSGWRTLHGLQWSPGGDEIWFTGSRNGKSSSLYAVSVSDKKVRLMFHAPGDITLDDVARDGRVLLSFGSVRARMIWSSEGQERDLSWFDWPTVGDLSADGKTVLFHESGEAADANNVVYTRPVDGSDAVELGEGKALALSPDGRWALALVEKDRPQLVLHPTGTGESRMLPTEGVKDVYWARWFPDSRRILLVAEFEEGVQTRVQDVDSGRWQRLGDIGTMGLLIHPDSRRILAVDAVGHHHIWPLDDGDPVPVAGLGLNDRAFQWSTDPRFLYVRGYEEQVLRIHRYNLATGRRDLWQTLAPRDPAGLIGLGTGRSEVAMTRDGKSVVFTYWTWIGDLFLVDGAR
jgi:Tol biopolymer transport system component/predicted Ser/Thr protein kinase